jgi:sugar/nucleoside kinase (ribokinase family)
VGGTATGPVRSPAVSTDLAVAVPAYLDLTLVGLEGLPGPGEETFAGDLVRSPGGGAITAVAAARLGLRTALVAPLGSDVAGEFVRREVEAEGVVVTGPRPERTPQTVVMPVAGDRSMVTVDPGVRARGADIAALEPRAVAANLEQLPLIPDGTRVYLTCGDDDARAFAGRPPVGLAVAEALFFSGPHACMLTGGGSPEEAAQRLAESVPTVVLTLAAPAVLAIADGRRIEVPSFDERPVVDPTGDRDLLCAAFAWARAKGADAADAIVWAQLYSQLAMWVPTATRGAVDEARLLEEGTARGLTAPGG